MVLTINQNIFLSSVVCGYQLKKDIKLNPYKMSSFINLSTVVEESENTLKDSKHFERWSEALGTLSVLVSILVKLTLKIFL